MGIFFPFRAVFGNANITQKHKILMVCGKTYAARTLIVGKVFVFVVFCFIFFFTNRNERRTDNPSTLARPSSTRLSVTIKPSKIFQPSWK